MARRINESFINELKKGSLSPILDYVVNDDTLNMELRGDRIIVYYRGGALFSVLEDKYAFEGMDNNYFLTHARLIPSLLTIEDYIPKAKHFIDLYVRQSKNHLGEKDIQQQIARENNYSSNSLDTDFFVIDVEYQDLGRFDIVALRWDSTSTARKLAQSYLPTITIFEVKQGYSTSSGTSGLKKHFEDFCIFTEKDEVVKSFKEDMMEVFRQKRELGLIDGMELIDSMGKYKDVKSVAEGIDFVFLMVNYKPKSSVVKSELELIKAEDYKIAPKFIYANSMGYGLFARNIISGEEFVNRFLCE